MKTKFPSRKSQLDKNYSEGQTTCPAVVIPQKTNSVSLEDTCLIMSCQGFSLFKNYLYFNFYIRVCACKYICMHVFSSFTVKVLCMYITNSSLVFLWVSSVCKQVGLCIYICFFHLFFGSFLSICLFCPIPMCQLYFILFCFISFYYYYHPQDACLFPNEREKVSGSRREKW